jgi:hypothetical protein
MKVGSVLLTLLLEGIVIKRELEFWILVKYIDDKAQQL